MTFKYCFYFIVIIIYSCTNQSGRRETFEQIVGTYELDIKKTNLGSSYLSDSISYSNLRITFLNDSTFYLNKDVPFIYSSKGSWTAGNVNEWCRLLFDGLNYNGLPYPGTQFTRPFIDNLDTFLLFNATTPKGNNKTISEIYFKKVKT